MVPVIVLNGSDGPAIRAKKNAATLKRTSIAQPTSGSEAERLKRTATAPTYPDRIRPQSSIEPARADHMPVIV